MSDVLITGMNGFLGKAISEKQKKCFNLFGLSRSSGYYNIELENDIPVFNKVFSLVIHSAGKAHVIPKNELEKKEFYKVNVVGTKNLLKGLEKMGVPKQFVFISSVSVYGLENGINIKEEDALLAKDPYGRSKIEAEAIVAQWCRKNNVVCTILRLPLLVGKCPPGNLGAMLKAIDRGYYFNIGGGKARKSMVLAEDVAGFIPKVAAVGGIFNLTDGVHPNFSELSSAISKQKKKKKSPLNLPLFIAKLIGYSGDIFGKKAPINSLKVKKIISDLTFDDSKARELLGWEPGSVLEYLNNNNL
ncbi:NAD-dependent epimerase/dehydratase family protein [Flavobacterium sp. LPB0248]|nr:NAD-dependent epimerase/dehydratase family protein [Flavobacterium sp. LPB0248]